VQPVSTQFTTGVRGTVVLRITVDKSGVPTKINLVSGNPLLSGPSIDAARQWRYKPYLVHGNPVDVETEITFDYPIACALPRC
jgi:protein TonB